MSGTPALRPLGPPAPPSRQSLATGLLGYAGHQCSDPVRVEPQHGQYGFPGIVRDAVPYGLR
ncbi:hypothetical protein MBAV_003781 [Candidatus Magnetobacterium bavaricum]|uniref:Uncharacterized protein n=1 Tax=Candidatus Magnetobacterium bavaricum TaxID=29290 RepID=A0A0F3GQC9_9BACT|nr:hypothetical protein MBAV_003781 [Candidatus Magnetobacterium bavaricum]